MRQHALLIICCFMLFALPGHLYAEQEFQSLFDGKTLDGWTVLSCEAEVQDGAIFLKGGDGIVHTNQKYGDFVLEIEWKAVRAEGYDSGIYFRCGLPEGNRPWPKRYQINLREAQEGNLLGVKGGKSEGLIKKGEWNKFRLEVSGTKASMQINGKPAWETDGVEEVAGYIALQCEVPGGGQFHFRNIRIAAEE